MFFQGPWCIRNVILISRGDSDILLIGHPIHNLTMLACNPTVHCLKHTHTHMLWRLQIPGLLQDIGFLEPLQAWNLFTSSSRPFPRSQTLSATCSPKHKEQAPLSYSVELTWGAVTTDDTGLVLMFELLLLGHFVLHGALLLPQSLQALGMLKLLTQQENLSYTAVP